MKKYGTKELQEAAWLVYEKGLSQLEASKRLGISRPTISRMLETAKKIGIVKIKVNIASPEEFIIKNALKETFHLKDVVIASSTSDEEDAKELVAQRASNYLTKLLKSGDTIGISWGTTLFKVVNQIPNINVSGIVVPLTGGVGRVANNLHSNTLAHQLATKLLSKSYALYAPAIVKNKSAIKTIVEEPSVKLVMDLYKKIRVALVGIGTLNNNSTVIKSGYYNTADFIEFKKKDAIGDICSYLFNTNGKIVTFPNNNVIGISMETLKKIPFVVGIASGVGKAKAIYSALKGKLINVLITDDNCGKEIIELQRTNKKGEVYGF